MALILTLLTLLYPACQSAPRYKEICMNPVSAVNGRSVEIRIKNASDVDFDRVRVIFPARDEVDYGRVAKGALSDFHPARRAYRYAEIHATSGDREFSLQPIDYVGEQPLAPGRYTYVLRVEAGRLTVDLEKAE